MTGTLLDELIWVHNMLRADLAAIRRIAAADPAEAGAELARLRSRSLLFQLKLKCLGYCNLVHSHHHHEDAGLFPPVLRTAPHLADVVERLIADHRVVSDLLDNVEAAAQSLESTGPAPLVAALETLSEHLLDHLAREEEALGPVLESWDRWPARTR